MGRWEEAIEALEALVQGAESACRTVPTGHSNDHLSNEHPNHHRLNDHCSEHLCVKAHAARVAKLAARMGRLPPTPQPPPQPPQSSADNSSGHLERRLFMPTTLHAPADHPPGAAHVAAHVAAHMAEHVAAHVGSSAGSMSSASFVHVMTTPVFPLVELPEALIVLVLSFLSPYEMTTAARLSYRFNTPSPSSPPPPLPPRSRSSRRVR